MFLFSISVMLRLGCLSECILVYLLKPSFLVFVLKSLQNALRLR
nr:MAG TPA: hypothetical protein [Caudoviricetes sp.]